MSLSSEIHHIRVRPAWHLLDLNDETGVLEHCEGLIARGEIEALVTTAREAQPDRDQFLRIGDRKTRISAALLGLHDERSALTKRRRGVLQHALLILERQEVEHVDNCHRVAVWRLVLDDVADLEAQPLRVAAGPARHFDLALV